MATRPPVRRFEGARKVGSPGEVPSRAAAGTVEEPEFVYPDVSTSIRSVSTSDE